MKKNYTKESALRIAKTAVNKQDGNKVFAGNTCSLRQCGALDFLANHCGFIVVYSGKE